MMDSKRNSALVLWIVVVLVLGGFAGARRAVAEGDPFFDDFSDMNFRDDMPTNWRAGVGTILDATNGDLFLTSAPPGGTAKAVGTGASGVAIRNFQDVSIRTQVRLLEGEPGGGRLGEKGVGLFARTSHNQDFSSYAAGILPDGEISIIRGDGGGVFVTLASMMTDLNVFSTDIHLQFDVFGDTLALTAWEDGAAKPVAPQLTVTDATYPGGRWQGRVGVIGQRNFPSTTAFRFFWAVPRLPVDLGNTTRRAIGIQVVANDCAPPAVTRVAPELTGPNIDNFGGGGQDHHVYYNALALERDELHVFLPGTDAPPLYASDFMEQAASHGTKTIGLQYVNGPNHDWALCWDSWGNTPPHLRDPDCMEKVLAERTYGDDLSPLVSVNQPNSVVSRLVKLLEYLDTEQPERGWGQYLVGGAPDWGRIVFSGHSQGSAITVLLARDHELMRAVILGGPYQVDPLGLPAALLTDPKATPIERYFAFVHRRDDFPWRRWLWISMGLPGARNNPLVEFVSPPYGGSHTLSTDVVVTPGFAHNSVVGDHYGTSLFKDAWLYMLGIEADVPCGGEAVHARDPGAALVEIPGGAALSFDHRNVEATITIPASAWAPVVAEGFGGCSVGGSDGLICESVSNYTIVIDLNDNLAVPGQDYWTGQLIAGGSTRNLTAREPDVAEDGFFYQEVAGQTIATACSTAASIPAGECLPTDLRPPEAYDPIAGAFTYLGVVDAFPDPAYGLSRFAIGEVAQPPASACDVNLDGFVDVTDIEQITAARDEPANGASDPRDADGDWTITVFDARLCALDCDSPECEPSDLAAAQPVPEPGMLILLTSGVATLALLVRRRRRDPAVVPITLLTDRTPGWAAHGRRASRGKLNAAAGVDYVG